MVWQKDKILRRKFYRGFVYFAKLLLFDDINRAYNGILIKEDNFMLFFVFCLIYLFILACFIAESFSNMNKEDKRKEEEKKKENIRKTFNIDIH
jgi:hypothetical protein